MEPLHIAIETDTIIRILLLSFLAFLLSMLLTPLYTTLAYNRQWWRKPGTKVTGEKAKMLELHAEKHQRHIPTMAGVIALVAVAAVTVAFNLSRSETWLPMAAFAGAAGAGLLDDIIAIRGWVGPARLASKLRLLLMSLVALIGGWFFYFKLDVSSVHVPLMHGQWHIGWLIIPLFIAVVVASAYSVNISDGQDGLAGGLAVSAFTVYAIIAALEGRFGVSGFCMTIVGALLSYTWFNIYPARFFMGDVGSFALGTALGVVAMLTDTVLILPVIAAVFVAEAGSGALQAMSIKLRHGKKIFKVAPLHAHFEASDWPETKVTMRFWVLGQVAGVLGLLVFLLGEYLK